MSDSTGVVCTQEEIVQSESGSITGSSLHCLTRAQSIGLAFGTEAGVISAVMITLLFLLIFRNYIRNRRSKLGSQTLIEGPMDLYVLCLFIFDIFQALGGVVNAKWVYDGKVYTGSFCTMQGAVQQLGETGVAMTTLVIALHTFCAVWWRRGVHDTLIVASAVVCVILLYVGLFAVIGVYTNTKGGNYYETPTPDWCWIGQKYTGERIAGESIWMWLSLIFSTVLYLPLFFLLRGNITVNEHSWWKFSIHCRLQEPHNYFKRSTVVLAYPFVYSVSVLPMTIGRWIQFSHPNATQSVIPTSLLFFGECMYRAGGAFNVVLFASTRSELLFFGKGTQVSYTGKAPSTMSLHNSIATGTDDAEAGTATVVINVEDVEAEAVERLQNCGLYPVYSLPGRAQFKEFIN